MQRAGKKPGASSGAITAAAKPPRRSGKKQLHGGSRFLHGGIDARWIVLSVALGIAVCAFKYSGVVEGLIRILRPTASAGGVGGVSTGHAALRIHETFGCQSEAKDFELLMAELGAAGVDVGNVQLGYSGGQRGLIVSASDLE